jgi:hypothetical protein
MPLNLTTDKIVISVKPDYQPVIMTGYTPTIIVGSGGTIVTQTGQTFVVYSSNSTLPTVLIGSGNTTVDNISGNTWRIYTPTGGTASITLVGSGQTTVTQSGDTWTINTPATDLSQYWTSGQTIDYVTGYTPTLDGYWNSGQTVGYVTSLGYITGYTVTAQDVTGITSSLYLPINGLAGYWNSGQTVGYINSKNYLTGFTVTAPMVTGITASLYAPIIHYHPQYLTGFTVTAPMVTGITSGLYLPIDALNGYWDSGQTVTYINNQGFITSLASYWTSAQTQSWVESQNYLTGFTVTAPMITGITSSLYLPINGLASYWTSAQTVNYVSGITSGLTSSWNDIEDKPSWLTGTTLNGFQTGHTHSYNNLNDKPTLFTGNTFVASGACQIATNGNQVTIYAPTGSTSFSGLTDVNVSGVTSGDTIIYTTEWVKSTPVDILDLVEDTYMLRRSGTTIVGIPYSVMTGATGVSGITPTLVFSGSSGTTVEYTKVGTTYTIGITGQTGAQGEKGETGASGSGATVLISSGATVATFVSGSTWNVYSPDYNYVTINYVTGSTLTLSASYNNEIIEMSSTGNTTITCPTGLTNTQYTVVNNGGGAITFAAGSGATLRSKDSKVKLSSKWGAVTLYSGTSGIWRLIGDLSS